MKDQDTKNKLSTYNIEKDVKKATKEPKLSAEDQAVIARANMGHNVNLIAAHLQMPVTKVKEILAKY